MITLDEVARIAGELPEVTVGARHGNTTWFVRGKAFAWERPFSKADVRRFGRDPVPPGAIVAVAVADLDDKEAVLAAGTRGVFTIPHFDGYAAVLLQLDVVPKRDARALLVDAWLAVAPPALADDYVASARRRRR